jgi:type I restriction enzyme S subunit
MRNYKPLGKYIQLIDERNTDLEDLPLLGLSVSKKFFPTIANLVGTDMKTYKIVYRNQFTYIADTSRRGDKIAIALNDRFDKMLVSQAYTPFEVKNTNELDPEYLMMWFRRPEFDRYARFKSHGSAREIFDWEEMCNTLLPVPHPNKQREIVKEYNVIQNRIALNQQLIQKLEETAQAIYREWFVEFEFPNENGNPYKSNGGEMVWNEELGKEIPKGWKNGNLTDVVNSKYPITYGVVKPGDEVENGVKFIRSGDLKNGEILFSQLRTISEDVSNQFKRTKLDGGEILISIVGNPGQVSIVPFFLKGANIARQVAMVKVANIDHQLFIKNQLVSEEGQKALKDITIGSVQDVINLEDLRLLKIIIPDSNVLNLYLKSANKTL